LFVDRARASVPWFTLSDRNVRQVVAICRALDGLPLAIELAASRLNVLGIEEMAARLGDRPRLLRGGNRTAPARQQTLQAALDWSHQLLSAAEQLLFARLSVFAGGWTLDAVERIGSGDGIGVEDVLDLLEQLVDCSLVQTHPTENGGMRYRLLETIQDYSQAQLRATGMLAVAATHRKHAVFFCELAEREDAELIGPTQAVSFGRIEREHDNLRAALRWTVADGGDSELGMRLGAALVRFWFVRGHLTEGSSWLDLLRDLPTGAGFEQTAARAKILNGAGNLATLRGEFAEARARLTESLELRRAIGDLAGAARTLLNLGNIATSEHDYPAAEELFNQSLLIQRDLGNVRGIARTLNNLAVLAREQGHTERMAALADEAFDLSRQVGDPEGIALALVSRGIAAHMRGQPLEAVALLERSLRLFAELGHRREIAENIELLAGLECLPGRPERAARLFGAAEAMFEAVGLMALPGDRFQYAQNLVAVRAALDADALATAWREGKALTLDHAVTYALNGT
jgi:tetratricopeptide (TPR) repeat protein